MKEYTGNIAKILAGHDKDRYYYIVDEDSQNVFLCDGNLKKWDNLKRKNKKHIQIIYGNSIESDTDCYKELNELNRNDLNIRQDIDVHVKHVLKLYNKLISK